MPSFPSFISLFLIISFLFSSCLDSTDVASTEVPNEIAVMKVIAADGYALSEMPYVLMDAYGNHIQRGHTDINGELFFDEISEEYDSPYLLHIIPDSLANVSQHQGTFHEPNQEPALDTNKEPMQNSRPPKLHSILHPVESDTIHYLLNPITDLVIRKLVKESIQDSMINISDITQEQILEEGERITLALFGQDSLFKRFFKNRDYRPALRHDTTQIPSFEDMILHSMQQELDRLNVPLESLHQQLHDEQRTLWEQEQFQSDLDGNIEHFHVPPEEEVRMHEYLPPPPPPDSL